MNQKLLLFFDKLAAKRTERIGLRVLYRIDTLNIICLSNVYVLSLRSDKTLDIIRTKESTLLLAFVLNWRVFPLLGLTVAAF